VPYSGLRLKEAYAVYDAERRFEILEIPAPDNPACECGAILRGVKTPTDCKLFGTVCTPETPMGSCMVSAEGACAAHWTYGRFRSRQRRTS
jgi:hydrogenase expression/formation protein HypD